MKNYNSSDMLCDLAEVVLKNNNFHFGKIIIKAKKKKRTVMGMKFVHPYNILFMVELEENIFRKVEFKLYSW